MLFNWKGVPVQQRRRMGGGSSYGLEEDGTILQYRSVRGRQDGGVRGDGKNKESHQHYVFGHYNFLLLLTIFV